jgi:serine/threonine-protein kinase
MDEGTDRLVAALADRYRLEREVGQGGMATVHLAHDLKHDRRVAVKVLKPALAAVLGADRFVAEIRTTAALQHPHILPLFDSGEADGFLYYVMPFVEGETLRSRLDRETQLGVTEAVRIATEVADALDYAHRHGVVHRDIKPENILLHDGRVMVVDFGIALAVSAAADGRMTETGLSLGTPHYMSPEQATASKEITGRSDIYSLGSVLYEMLTGAPPHTGASAAQIIAKIVTEEAAPVTKLRTSAPPNVAATVAQALEKLPADRFESAARFAEALNDPGFAPARAATALARGAVRPDPWRTIALGAGAFAALLLALAIWGWSRSMTSAVPALPIQFPVELPPGISLPPPGADPTVAVSPEGGAVVFAVRGEGASSSGASDGPLLYVRTLADPVARELPGTRGATNAFFSPDGRIVGFLAQGRLRRMDLSGGIASTIVEPPSEIAGATWGANDDILYSLGNGSGLWRVPAAGGEPSPVTALDSTRGDVGHIHPHFLPDGRSFVFTIVRDGTSTPLAAGTLDGRIDELGQAGQRPHYVPGSGHLLYSTAGGELIVARFDPARLRITGPPALVTDGIHVATSDFAMWSVSRNGTIAVDRGSARSRLVRVDRDGTVQPLSAEIHDFRLPRVSPDGERIAVQVARTGEDGIWLLDRGTGALARFTPRGSFTDAIWTPDGRRLAFATTGVQESFDIHWQPADGSGRPERLVSAPGNQWPWSWTPAGDTIVYDEIILGRPTRIMAAAVAGNAASRVVVESGEYSNRLPRLSPDGRWLAHTSDETGRVEVYVRPFAGMGGKQQISLGGGNQPVWSRDGREIYYRDGEHLVAAALGLGSVVSVTARTPLFDDVFAMSNATNYDVLPDGSGFVMLEPLESTRQLTVMVNWLDELRRMAGEK